MKNLDMLQQKKAEILQKINQAVKDGDEEAFATAFTQFTDVLQEAVLAEAKGLVQSNDNQVLIGRGVRVLTSDEKQYYNKLLEAMKDKNPQQALTLIDESMPRTVIDAVFEDITEAHPLLDLISFENTGVLTEIIVSSLDGRHKGVWGKLCDEIVEELLGGFQAISLTQKKLSAFIPVCKAMLEVGPEWLDRYVRAILGEAIANGLEEGIVDGNGLDEPTGMMRNPAGALDPVTGYPELAPVVLNAITPQTYGPILSTLATGPNLLARAITEVVFIVNPITYFAKVMPAITVRAADGSYVEKWPFPTRTIQSVFVPVNKAIIGLPKRYFFGLGTGKEGKIDYSDHYHFLEDERVYLTKLYGNGKPLDAGSFIVLDITNLVPVIPNVYVTNWPATMNVDVIDDPLAVDANDARLASLTIGALTLSPAFNKSIYAYTAATANATDAISAIAMDGEATIEILNGAAAVQNGAAATWAEGANALTINVSVGGETEQYVVTVTYTPEG